jgi:hypothetical protein
VKSFKVKLKPVEGYFGGVGLLSLLLFLRELGSELLEWDFGVEALEHHSLHSCGQED